LKQPQLSGTIIAYEIAQQLTLGPKYTFKNKLGGVIFVGFLYTLNCELQFNHALFYVLDEGYRRINMRIPSLKLILILFSILCTWSNSAFAVPDLQLDIGHGTYSSATETIVTASDSFTLYALLNPSDKAPATGTYYISAALFYNGGAVPKDPSLSLGSFSFNGQPISVISDMIWGTPPVAVVEDNLNLPDHNAFPSYYKEFSFVFDSSDKAAAYNTADDPGGPVIDDSGSFLYKDFLVDVSGLTEGYSIHFDFYSQKLKKGVWEVDQFAPFSHDAQSDDTRDTPNSAVPEPATLVLFGFGLIGLAGFQRRLTKR
jgi:hypothetical protein